MVFRLTDEFFVWQTNFSSGRRNFCLGDENDDCKQTNHGRGFKLATQAPHIMFSHRTEFHPNPVSGTPSIDGLTNRFYHCTKLHSNLIWGAPSTGGWIDQRTDTAACDLKEKYQRRGGGNEIELTSWNHFHPWTEASPSYRVLPLYQASVFFNLRSPFNRQTLCNWKRSDGHYEPTNHKIDFDPESVLWVLWTWFFSWVGAMLGILYV